MNNKKNDEVCSDALSLYNSTVLRIKEQEVALCEYITYNQNIGGRSQVANRRLEELTSRLTQDYVRLRILSLVLFK